MSALKKNTLFKVLEIEKCVSIEILQHIYFKHKFTMFFIHRDMHVCIKNTSWQNQVTCMLTVEISIQGQLKKQVIYLTWTLKTVLH